jgi:nucleotide-binding universal stress UspA family protein
VPPFRTILVVTEDSTEGLAAVQYATSLAAEWGARLVLFTLIPQMIVSPYDAHSVVVSADMEQHALRHHREILDALPADILVESRVAYGKPTRKFREACEASGCDLVVVPAPRPRGLLERLVQPYPRIVRASNVPVVFIGADESHRHEDASRIISAA